MAARVRILTLEPDELLRAEARNYGQAVDDAVELEDEDAVIDRQREITQVRHHAFLHQTLPPCDPLVRDVERRRSGSED